MRNDCNIVRDLLPLYAEGLASADSVEFVRGHLEGCDGCREILKGMTRHAQTPPDTDAAPIRALGRKMRLQKIRTIALTAVVVLALAVSGFAALTAPLYLPYDESHVTIEETAGGALMVTFGESVTGCRLRPFGRMAEDPSVILWGIEAWTTRWDRLRGTVGMRRELLNVPEGSRALVFYLPNNGEGGVHVYGIMPGDVSGFEALPRLALGYWLILAALMFCLLMAARFLLRKRETAVRRIDRLLLLPPAYGIAHLLIVGGETVTYSIEADFSMIVLAMALIFTGMLLVQSIVRSHREIRRVLPNKYNDADTEI